MRFRALHVSRLRHIIAVVPVGLLSLVVSGCSPAADPDVRIVEGMEQYSRGQYAEALPLLEKELAKAPAGALLYQVAFARQATGTAPGDPEEIWGAARARLEEELAAPGGVTVERLYYLTVIGDAVGDFEAMREQARRAVDEIENGPDPNALGGEDWFRLARMHDFLEEPSGAEACYRRAVSGFRKTPAINAVYRSLTLARVADLDFRQDRFDTVAAYYDAALQLFPGTNQINPYKHGLSLVAVGRFEDAITRFEDDRDPATMTESRYAADLARKAVEAGPLEPKDGDGTEFRKMSLGDIDDRIRDAGRDFRATREKYSYKPGDSLTGELKNDQRRFAALMRERLLRTEALQDFCLSEGVAARVRG